jgi:two-component system sensor histidine kinase KdpD
MTESRADSFLRMIRKAQRGKLKIYLGYCAGVGKTYEMLLEARRLRADGIDVVAGVVETHGRKETDALLKGLESIPRRRITYRGIEIDELDLGAVIARRPGVVLVDELAHTNVPGSKNEKRYQDVEEILAVGIHVISTLNIQHLESLYETVERVTGIKVRERVPDRVVAEADQLVNVDVTTEDLRQRLKEGKVYTSETIETALTHFFKSSNLEQLRELTLREMAAQIDARRRDPLAEEPSTTPDQVMVCLSSRGGNSEALLRYASRLAGRLNRNWYAVYVQTASESPMVIDAETQRVLSTTLALAEQLGATVFTYKGEDIVETILQFAKEYRVGHIVIGSPGKTMRLWDRLLRKATIAERLIAENKGVTVVVLDTRRVGEEPCVTGETASSISSAREGATAVGAVEVEAVGAFAGDTRDDVGDTRAKRIPLIPGHRIALWGGPMEKEDALRQLVKACCRNEPMISETDAWDKLMQRERQGVTFVGEDVAIPHARLEGLGHPVIAVGVSRIGVHDPAANEVAHIMILLFSSASESESHVRLLGEISKMVRDPGWRKSILETQSVQEIAQILEVWSTSSRKDG